MRFGFHSLLYALLNPSPPLSPQCNKKAKRSDIVLLYAHKLRVLDNTEQESMKR